jgi:hypothetical protein
MSGILQLMLAAGLPSKRFAVTIGDGSGIYRDGYISNDTHTSFGNIGSIDSGTTDTLTAPGSNIVSGHVDEFGTGLSRDFAVGLFRSSGNYVQADFTGVRVYNPSGTLVATYLTASANFLAGGSFDEWRWGTGSSPPWTFASHGGQVWGVELF